MKSKSSNAVTRTPKRRNSTGSSLFRTPSRKGWSPFARTAANAAINAGLQFVPGGPQLRAAYQIGRGMFNNVRQWTAGPGTFGARKFGLSTGRLKGKFAKPKKLKGKNPETTALKYGFHSTNEIYGAIRDTHTVYIKHSTVHYSAMAETIQKCILRKLFQQGGILVTHPDQELPFFSWENSDGFKVVYELQSPTDGGVGHAELTSIDNESLNSFALRFATMYEDIYGYLTGSTQNYPSKVYLYASDRNVLDTNWRCLATLDFQSLKFEINCKSVLSVQNRSAPADAATEAEKRESDRIDNQPLIGKIFEFTSGDPRLGSTLSTANPLALGGSNFKLAKIDQRGLELVRSIDVGTSNTYQEMPNAKYFANCNKTSSIMLQPGDIKYTTIKYTYKGSWKNLSKQLQADSRSGFIPGPPVVTQNIAGIWGRSQIVGLEEKIRTPKINPITCNYERKYTIGVVIKKVKSPAFPSKLTTLEINNV